jgi:hypothetical protein
MTRSAVTVRNTEIQDIPPGGHTEYRIVPKIDRAHPTTHPAMPQKYEINRVTRFAITLTVRNTKSKMSAWRPYWISDRTRNRKGKSPNPPRYVTEIWNQSGDPFCSYSPEYKIKDIRLLAILNIGSCPKGYLPPPPTCPAMPQINLKISPLPLLHKNCLLVIFFGTIQVTKQVHFLRRVRQWGAEIIWVIQTAHYFRQVSMAERLTTERATRDRFPAPVKFLLNF